MKLFLIEIDNGADIGYLSEFKLIVDKDIASASIKAVEFMHDYYGSDPVTDYGDVPKFHVTEIKEVDGYAIKLQKQ